MKKVFLLAFLFMGIMNVKSIAQEATEEVTEEEILKFATMEESVANFLDSMETASTHRTGNRSMTPPSAEWPTPSGHRWCWNVVRSEIESLQLFY